MSRRIPIAVWALLVLVVTVSAKADPVKVTATPATVENQSFDPAKPPKQLEPGEDGLTECSFSCDPHFTYHVVGQSQKAGSCMTTIKIDSIDVTIGLAVKIWLPNNAPKKLRDHEEGHRQICEEVYKGAEKAAREAGKALIGKTFEGTGDNCQKAEENALNAAVCAFCAAYGATTADAEGRIGDIYDDLTKHGTNGVSEKDAIKDAFKKYQEEQKKKP
jgi:hypothetical protein